jgi:magnesium-transporting ATPase (P-type)
MMTVSASRAGDAYRRDAANVAAELGGDVRLGLSSTEAAARLERYGPNEMEPAEKVAAWRKVFGQFASPLICSCSQT